ncbi:hypothetical protein A2917_02265 [Candidatus Nomurabacteria bacterium RIFCSPLOWO2_01_FULL_42_17]|uniref:Uncharacterized protein n=1 Tax=Candidatus Nomurabacteria bacterium RIFCSPLOWO2_01_FULL_42_17 TaxID=1801780 RepID=A0A1F6XMY9_9BACT|nr:MAG: hypothetical protein A2917_02265 [Candidatus Nomurabacteria bacterium RIFCSPLOWO2_01_FULL_42_17]
MKKDVKNKKMTVDKLAIMVANGFEEASRNMARVENNLIYHIGGINRRLDDMSLNKVKYEDYNKLKTRVDIIEKNLK